jgi:hypothetical protein
MLRAAASWRPLQSSAEWSIPKGFPASTNSLGLLACDSPRAAIGSNLSTHDGLDVASNGLEQRLFRFEHDPVFHFGITMTRPDHGDTPVIALFIDSLMLGTFKKINPVAIRN